MVSLVFYPLPTRSLPQLCPFRLAQSSPLGHEAQSEEGVPLGEGNKTGYRADRYIQCPRDVGTRLSTEAKTHQKSQNVGTRWLRYHLRP